MLPLLYKDGLVIPYFVTSALFFIISHKIHKFWNIFKFKLEIEEFLVKSVVSILLVENKKL